eukprot:Lankesteria_metandrocarpae@DN673_c0_g1_i1.p1
MSSTRTQKPLRLASSGTLERNSESKLLKRFRSFGAGLKDKAPLDFEFETSPNPSSSTRMRSASSTRKPQTVAHVSSRTARQQSNRNQESSTFGRAHTFQESSTRNSFDSSPQYHVMNRVAPNISHHSIAIETDQHTSNPSETSGVTNSQSPMSPAELRAHYSNRQSRKPKVTRAVGYASAQSFSSPSDFASAVNKEHNRRELGHQPETGEYANYVSDRVWNRVKQAQLKIQSQGTLGSIDASSDSGFSPKKIDTESGDDRPYGYDKMYTALSSSILESAMRGNDSEAQQHTEVSVDNVAEVDDPAVEDIAAAETDHDTSPLAVETDIEETVYVDAFEAAEGEAANCTEPDVYTPEMIAKEVHVKKTTAKGRCLYTKNAREPGDIIFVENPVMVAVPSLNKKLWTVLEELNEEKEFSLPPIWHLAALCSLTMLPKASRDIILDKWVPEPDAAASTDVMRVLSRLPRFSESKVYGRVYQRALDAWRFNSFGHHTEENGLVLFNSISMMAHSCHATATWHYGNGSAFVLRARQHLPSGGEISISYIGDEELCKPTHLRREHLSSWLFTCACDRCIEPIDRTRGFRCSTCGVGTFYLKSESATNPSDSPGVLPVPTACDCCDKLMSDEDVLEFVKLEDAYISRLTETDATDLVDACSVFHQAQRMFTSHWVLCSLHAILFDAFKSKGNYYAALHHQKERLCFLNTVLPKASFTVAWLHESLGDVLATKLVGPELLESDKDLVIDPFLRHVMTRAYEDVYNLMAVLCGYDHEYTHSARAKLDRTLCTTDIEDA